MSKVKWLAMLAAVAALGFSIGCESEDDDNGGGGGGGNGGGTSGSFAGTWTGNICGRGLTMVLSQNGTALSGSYTISDPTYNGTCSGSLAGTAAPTTAHLDCAGHNWWFELSFGSYNQMSGQFFKAENNGDACAINATK